MADQFDEILSAATGGTSEQLKPEPSDEILKAAVEPPSSVSGPVSDPILAAAGAAPQAPSYSKLFTEGVARNWAQMKSVPPSLQAMYEESQGNQAAAVSKAQEAQGILREAGDSKYELFKNVHDPEDFSYWLTEKLGEQGVTALATLMTGGVGGVGTSVVGSQLLKRGLISTSSYKAMQLAGAMVPTYALSSAMEGAGTSQEQFEVTGSPQAGLSTAAGLTKGLLELWTPMSVARSLISPGTVLGKSIPGAIGKTALKEGSTEYAQELIDIAARKYSDPSYSFFGTGATPWYQGEGFLRAAESGATGFAVGGVYGAPFAGVEAKRARADALGTQPFGDRALVPKEEVPHPTQPAGRVEPVFTQGPVSTLRDMVIPPGRAEDKLSQEAVSRSPRDDVIGMGPLTADVRSREQMHSAVVDQLDAVTPRYVEVRPDGTLGNQLFTDTELELHSALNIPQAAKPRWLKVDHGSLQPAAISAHILDLGGMERVWFLPGVSKVEQTALLQRYFKMYDAMKEAHWVTIHDAASRAQVEQTFKDEYGSLLTAGLRVVPSRGAGFYYNGVVKTEGAPVEAGRLTKRSNEIAWYNPVSGVLSPFRADEQSFNAEPMAKGESIIVSVDWNKVNEGDILKLENGDFALKRVDNRKLIPGIRTMTLRGNQDLYTTTWNDRGVGSTIIKENLLPTSERLAGQMEEALKKIQPAMVQILKSIGIDQKIPIVISDNAAAYGDAVKTSPAAALLNHGVVALFPDNWKKEAITSGGENFEAKLYQVVMHEMGHLVAYTHFTRLPIALQDGLNYAWEQSLLAGRMGDLSRVTFPVEKMDVQERAYWLSFPEFLAEQFRRWASSDRVPRTWAENSFKGIGEKIERFYKEFEGKISKKEALNLALPDHYFSAVMQYLRDYGDEKRKLEQLLKQQELWYVPQDILDSPVAFSVAKQVVMAIQSWEHLRPRKTEVVLSNFLDPGIVPGQITPASEGAAARWIHVPGKNVQLVELAIGTMKAESAFDETRLYIPHEYQHAYEDLGLYSPEEIAILMKDIKGHEQELFPAQDAAALKRRIREVAGEHKMGPEWVEMQFKKMYERELRAYYIQQYADKGVAFSEAGKGVIARFLEFFERLRNFIQGLGFQSKEDILRAFFKGEIVARQDRAGNVERVARRNVLSYEAAQGIVQDHAPDVTQRVGDYNVHAWYEGNIKDKLKSPYIIYNWTKAGNSIVLGQLELSNAMPKGFEISWLQNEGGFGLLKQMMDHAEADLGIKMKVSGELTDQGYLAAKGWTKLTGKGNIMDLYQKVKIGGVDYWVSPHKLQSLVYFWTRMASSKEDRENMSEVLGKVVSQKDAIKALAYYRGIYARLPESVWSDPRLEQMFALRRNTAWDGIQGSMVREGQKADENGLLKSMGFPADEKVDGWTQAVRRGQEASRMERARESGLSLSQSAPESMLSYESRRVWERLTGYGNDPRINKELKNLAHEVDRIGWFTKVWWTLDHLLWRNEHIQGLRNYRENIERMKQLGSFWLNRADETAREWEKVADPKRRDGIAQTLFLLTEMDYLSGKEKSDVVKRLPAEWSNFLAGDQPTANSELDRLFKKAGLDSQDHGIIRRVQGDFAEFLNQVEGIRDQILQKAHGNTSQAYLTGKAALEKEMNELRSKPYFPMVRFGQFTLTVRDATDNKVIWANAYETQSQRDAAVPDVRRQFPAGDITIGRVDPRMQEFMGLPGPLLRMIREKLPIDIGLSQKDKENMQLWLEEFEMLNAPDRSFRKRWMPAKGIPGYSMDAFRAYAHYFMYGSRYIARLAYMDELQSNINSVNATVTGGNIGNTAKRQAIVKYMKDHYEYMMEGGRDSAKFRAFASLWFLGFSPAAATMNLTQPLMTLWPKVTADFGLGQANAVLSQGFNALKATMGYATGNERFEIAKQEMIRQGYLDVGQAAELGAFAEGNNLNRLLSGTKLQKNWRALSYYGMKMFSVTEHFNRQLTFKVAWDLAMKNPNAEVLQKIGLLSPLERSDLMQRIGLSYQEAIAFLYAKDAIKRTQFEFSKDTDPPFMRNPKLKNFLIFFKYTHSMLYALRFNGAMFQSMLLLAFLYGLQGLPGSDEANEILRLLARKLFGNDFDLQEKARSFVRDVTRGTVFDEAGPDLFMHGISRYGFGLGLLPEGWGAPRFDASVNGSMGRIVPGLAEALHGINTDQKFPDMFAQSAQRAAGAGYGQMMGIMKFLMSPTATDSHQWEQLLPRFMKGWAAAYRYGVDPQAETTQAGAKIARFNVNDPDDLATIAAQAFGFRPTKVNETWEMIRNAREEVQVYNARKAALYVQFNRAMQVKDPEALDEVISAIQRYNEQVTKVDANMGIKVDSLRQAMKQRASSKEMMEQFLASSKRDILVTERIKDLYPGVRVEKVK